jgi:hypothetical protein
MSRLRVHNFTVSLDGFATDPRQSPENVYSPSLA